MSLVALSTAAGGLALFLLAMQMMTDGLKAFGGAGLRHLLGRWTSTPLRGVAAGMLVTALVQSSSAVTVAAIGFVNAGMLSLRQALGVIFGTNVGTTMTGWLVSLVGFGLKIEALALPLLAVGVALRLSARAKRAQGLGEALAGFGLFFLGLSLLQEALGGLAAGVGAADGLQAGRAAPLAIGFLVTLLTQSSSAAIAVILTAAAGGMIGIEAAALAVVGANVGTTSTAALATLRATAAARRLALGHIAFNLITAAAALALLPLLLPLVSLIAFAQDGGGVAAALAAFHTLFNLLGVALLLPFTGAVAGRLERLFHSADEDLARPQHLDRTLATTPTLASAAVEQELRRLQEATRALAHAALSGDRPLDRQADAARALAAATAEFVGGLRTERMPRDVADALTRSLRAMRHLDEVARLAPVVQRLLRPPASGAVAASLAATRAAAVDLLTAAAAEAPARLATFEQRYQQGKSELLQAVIARALPVDEADALLDDYSGLRRLAQEWTAAVTALAPAGRDAAGD